MNIHFSSKTNEWATPQDFYDQLNKEFNFTLDPCADATNYKCPKYYTQSDNGLAQSWDNETVFCNPPYGREIKHWVKKASEAVGGVVVMLIPARTCTSYFHDYVYNKAEIRFIRGRLKFGDSKNSAPFPSMVVVFRNNIV
jgi:site-specific DNA-methyltransferase (adenine-specific)